MKIQRLVFPDKNRCEVEEAQLDEKLEPNQALLKTKVTLISAGTELAMFTRSHRGFDEPDFGYAKYPFRPGYLAVSEVVASTCSIKTGALVFTSGPHATYSREMADDLVPLPAGINPEHATFLGLASISMTSVRLAPARAGANVVVIGMGNVGNLCAQLYGLCGAITAGVDLSEKRLATAKSCGIDKAFCTANKPLTECVKELGPRGAEFVIEAIGSSRTISDAFKAVAERGTIVLLGSPRTKMEIDPYFDIHRTGIHIIGAHGRNVDGATIKHDKGLLLEWIRSGKLHVAPLITQHMPMAQGLKGFEGLRDKPDEYLGVILTY
jgi:threonine dehydrogenase-like Zn-dependent dehydrogenase